MIPQIQIVDGVEAGLIVGYAPSEVSSHKIYITKKEEVDGFFREIKPENQKHKRRFEAFKYAPVG